MEAMKKIDQKDKVKKLTKSGNKASSNAILQGIHALDLARNHFSGQPHILEMISKAHEFGIEQLNKELREPL